MDAKLVKATKALLFDGVCYEGCPILVLNGTIAPVPSFWFMWLWRDKKADTAWAYAYGLKSWLEWLVLRGIEWFEITPDDVSRFRRVIEQSRANSTANVSIAAVASFYAYAYAEGFTLNPPFRVASARSLRDVGNQPFVQRSRVLKRAPRTHSKDEFDTILGHSPRQTPGLSLRDEIVAELARQSFLRRGEIAGLTLEGFHAAIAIGEHYLLDLKITKYSKRRSVPLSGLLHHRIQRYVSVYRSKIVCEARRKQSLYEEPPALFLTQQGKPMRGHYITSSWAVAAKAAKIKSRFHMHRHTGATALIRATKAAGLPKYQYVREILGHSFDQTTAGYDHTGILDDEVGTALIESVWADEV